MKYFFIICSIFLVVGCSSQGETSKVKEEDKPKVENSSQEDLGEEGQEKETNKEELSKELEYVETVIAAMDKIESQTLELEEASLKIKQSDEAPEEYIQVYSSILISMQEDYTQLLQVAPPKKFSDFHTSFLKTMDYQAVFIKEILEYFQTSEEQHLVNSKENQKLFLSQFEESIELFNVQMEEMKAKNKSDE